MSLTFKNIGAYVNEYNWLGLESSYYSGWASHQIKWEKSADYSNIFNVTVYCTTWNEYGNPTETQVGATGSPPDEGWSSGSFYVNVPLWSDAHTVRYTLKYIATSYKGESRTITEYVDITVPGYLSALSLTAEILDANRCEVRVTLTRDASLDAYYIGQSGPILYATCEEGATEADLKSVLTSPSATVIDDLSNHSPADNGLWGEFTWTISATANSVVMFRWEELYSDIVTMPHSATTDYVYVVVGEPGAERWVPADVFVVVGESGAERWVPADLTTYTQ